VGSDRDSGEKELILCNMLARRADLLALGGFNEALYPNEENALMDELQKRGGRLIYDPQLIVFRHPRPTLAAFCRMLMTYGRGRAEQFRTLPTLGSAPNFVPPLFCVYLVVFWWFGWIGALPLALYAVAVLLQTLALLPHGGVIKCLCAMPLLVLSHLCYGLGFWRGIFTKLNAAAVRAATPVELEHVKSHHPAP
jgi:hypothetical protein